MSAVFAAESAGGSLAFPILSMLIFVPVAGAVVIMLLSKRRPEYIRLVAGITSVATAAMSVWLLAEFDKDDSGFQFVSKHPWIEQWGISWHLGVDGISLFLVVLTGEIMRMPGLPRKPLAEDVIFHPDGTVEGMG